MALLTGKLEIFQQVNLFRAVNLLCSKLFFRQVNLFRAVNLLETREFVKPREHLMWNAQISLLVLKF